MGIGALGKLSEERDCGGASAEAGLCASLGVKK